MASLSLHLQICKIICLPGISALVANGIISLVIRARCSTRQQRRIAGATSSWKLGSVRVPTRTSTIEYLYYLQPILAKTRGQTNAANSNSIPIDAATNKLNLSKFNSPSPCFCFHVRITVLVVYKPSSSSMMLIYSAQTCQIESSWLIHSLLSWLHAPDEYRCRPPPRILHRSSAPYRNR